MAIFYVSYGKTFLVEIPIHLRFNRTPAVTSRCHCQVIRLYTPWLQKLVRDKNNNTTTVATVIKRRLPVYHFTGLLFFWKTVLLIDVFFFVKNWEGLNEPQVFQQAQGSQGSWTGMMAFPEIRFGNSPVGSVEIYHDLQGFLYIPDGWSSDFWSINSNILNKRIPWFFCFIASVPSCGTNWSTRMSGPLG